MQQNMGKTDKLIRRFISLIIVILYCTKIINSTFGNILLVIAIINFGFTFIGVCVAYLPFGLSTCNRKNKIQ